jgi:hypothetical protein
VQVVDEMVGEVEVVALRRGRPCLAHRDLRLDRAVCSRILHLSTSIPVRHCLLVTGVHFANLSPHSEVKESEYPKQ